MHNKYRKLYSYANDALEGQKTLNEELGSAALDRTDLRARVEELKHFETKYKNWKEKEPEFLHYLRSFGALARFSNCGILATCN